MSRPPRPSGPPVPERVVTAPAGRSRHGLGGRVETLLAAVVSDSGPRWVSGVVAGLQAALLSLLVVVLPAVTAYVATSADPANADIGWTRSAGVGAALWLLGHGGTLTAGGATVTLAPLGITALALFTAYASARRSAHPDRTAWWAGTVAYTAAVALVVLLAGVHGPLGSGPGAVVRTLVGGAAVGCVGLALGLPRRARVLPFAGRWSVRVHPVASHAVRGGVLALALLCGLASVLTAVWVVAGRAATGDVVEGLGVDTLGGVLLAAAQTALAPNLVLWVVAWLAGPGFAVGAGTSFAPGGVVSGPLPALPMLGALPPQGSGGGPLQWVPVLVVAVGALVGLWLHRRLVPGRAGHVVGAALGTAVSAGLLTGAASALAGGSAGPGRLAVVGASPVLVAAAVAALTGFGVLAVSLPASPLVRRAVTSGARRLTRRPLQAPDASGPHGTDPHGTEPEPPAQLPPQAQDSPDDVSSRS